MNDHAKVLFVDDEPQSLRSMKAVFHKQPLQLITAGSASEALQVLAAESVDVVISDERMPGMRGSELLAIVRAQYPTTVRMMLTGHADPPEAVGAAGDAAVHRFFTKPCPGRVLIEAIDQSLQERELADPPRG